MLKPFAHLNTRTALHRLLDNGARLLPQDCADHAAVSRTLPIRFAAPFVLPGLLELYHHAPFFFAAITIPFSVSAPRAAGLLGGPAAIPARYLCGLAQKSSSGGTLLPPTTTFCNGQPACHLLGPPLPRWATWAYETMHLLPRTLETISQNTRPGTTSPGMCIFLLPPALCGLFCTCLPLLGLDWDTACTDFCRHLVLRTAWSGTLPIPACPSACTRLTALEDLHFFTAPHTGLYLHHRCLPLNIPFFATSLSPHHLCMANLGRVFSTPRTTWISCFPLSQFLHHYWALLP